MFNILACKQEKFEVESIGPYKLNLISYRECLRTLTQFI